MKVSKVLCIGDSLCLPREGCAYDDTWYAKVKQYYPDIDFIPCFQGGLTVHDAINLFTTHFRFCKADVLVLQFGICDCAPRYFNENRLISKLIISLFTKLGLGNLFWRFVKSFGRRPDCVYTKPLTFYSLYYNLVEQFLTAGGKCVLIKIGHGSSKVVKSSPFFNKNVDIYNSLIDKISNQLGERVITINPLDIVDDGMFIDGYHCNKVGMDVVRAELEKILHFLLVND